VSSVYSVGDQFFVTFKDQLPSAQKDALDGSTDQAPLDPPDSASILGQHAGGDPLTTPLLRDDGVLYATPKPSSFGMEMCDRDFRVNTCILDPAADSFEDLKVNPSTRIEEDWNEMSLNGVYKADGSACSDQADADANGVLSVWDYCAKQPGTSNVITYELRDGLLYVDPGLATDWSNMTEQEKFGHRAYAVIAPDIPGSSGGSIAVFDSYLGIAPNRTVEALSPQATILDPTGPGGSAGALLRLYIFHPAGKKLSHVLRLVSYRAPGTF
jgi:hypothetical protein